MRLPTSCVAVLCALSASASAAQTVHGGADDRLELMDIVFRLAGNPEYNRCSVPGYNRAITEWFAPFAEHPAVRAARDLGRSANIGFDAVQSLGIHLTPLPELKELRSFSDTSISLDRRWSNGRAQTFLPLLRDFARDAHVVEFLVSQRALLDTAGNRLNALVRSGADFSWFERFFGPRPGARLFVVPGTCNGGSNYGPRFLRADGGWDIYAIVGAASDSAGQPLFTNSAIALVVHEFNHSFVNPEIDAAPQLFQQAASMVFARVEPVMQSQAYGDWRTLINESIVRAAAARYALARNGPVAGRNAIMSEMERGFVWTEELHDLLGRYERERAVYPDFRAFIPEIARYFSALAPRIDSVIASWEARRPKLVSIQPANGDTTVVASVATITLRFDRPMSTGYSINLGPGGKATFPEIIGQSWSVDRTVFILNVRLQPSHQYEFVLAGPGFRSAEGVPLALNPVRFKTRAPR